MLSWKKLIIILAATIAFLNPFGAYRGRVDTHQLICRIAYQMLQADPVFLESGFPGLEDILRYEGVEWDPSLTSLLNVSGSGPDVEGSTNYSDHYYNPRIDQGRAPTFVAENFHRLSQGIYAKNYNANILRSAAWAAHGIADMCVPYHVVGASAEQTQWFINRKQNFLDENVTGPLYLYDPRGNPAPFGWGGNNNFEKTLIAFRNYNNGAPVIRGSRDYRDWYDPWYLNGSGTELTRIISSSHATWETDAHRIYNEYPYYSGRYFDTRYHPLWKNARQDPSFSSSPWVRQAERAKEFAKAVAGKTRERIKLNLDNHRYSIERAVMSVLTLWRASMTGIQLDLVAGPGSGEHPVVMKCSIFNNVPDDNFQNINLKVTTYQEGIPSENIFSIKREIPGGAVLNQNLGAYVDPYRDWEVFIEITGSYNRTPDFQYASIKRSFSAQIKFDEDIGLNPKDAPVFEDFDPPATGESIVVPDVLGLHIQEAVKKIKNAGFVADPWTNRWPPKGSGKNCQVYSVSVFGMAYSPGIKVEKGTKITLYFYQGHGCLKKR